MEETMAENKICSSKTIFLPVFGSHQKFHKYLWYYFQHKFLAYYKGFGIHFAFICFHLCYIFDDCNHHQSIVATVSAMIKKWLRTGQIPKIFAQIFPFSVHLKHLMHRINYLWVGFKHSFTPRLTKIISLQSHTY